MDPQYDSPLQDEPFYQNDLTPAQKALRERFVEEYLYDRNSYHAALRCGFMSAFAMEYSRRFLEEAYVQNLIKFYDKGGHLSGDKQQRRVKEERVEQVLMHLAEMPSVPERVRVSAAGKLALIYGMNAPLKTQTDVNHRGGVMMVPAIASVDDWEQSALASQEKLVLDASN